MAKVFLGLGSNIQPHTNISNALTALQNQFGDLELSPVYESEAVGFDGDNFLNLVALITTNLSIAELQNSLKDLEDSSGRDRTANKYSGRTLDIDILLYDNVTGLIDNVILPRDEILTNAFVLKPLSDLAPNTTHPVNGKTMSELWNEYDLNQQKLWKTALVKPEH